MLIKRTRAIFLIVVLSLSMLQFPIRQVEAQSVTNIPFVSGDVAPNIAFDSSTNRAWANYFGGSGLFRWDKGNGTTKVFTIPSNMESGDIQPRGLALDGLGNVWTCTTRFIYKFVPQDGVFTQIVSASSGGCRMIYDGTYIWSTYNDGVKRITPSTASVTDIVVSAGCNCHSLTSFNSGVLVVDRGHNRLYEVSSSLIVSQRISGLVDPYGIQCSGATCYMAEFSTPKINNNTWTGGYVKQIATLTWTYIVRNLTAISSPTDVVIYSGFAGILDQKTKTVRIYTLSLWASTINISLSFTPLYAHVDINGNVYVGYHGSAGIIAIDNPFVVEPIPPSQPQQPGQGDQRAPVGEVRLSGDFIAKRGQNLNITVSFSKNVSGQVYLYAGENYIGREFLGYASMGKNSQKTISIKPDWIGSKLVFVKYSGDANYKGNVSVYIKLESILPVSGINTIKTNASVGNSEIVASLYNNDKYYMQNITAIVQIKDSKGEVVYLAWLRDLQIQPSSFQTFNVPRGGALQRSVEVYVWKSLEGGVMSEVSKITYN